MGTDGTDPPLTLQEAADLLGVHYMTAYRYVRLGLLPAEKVGSAWRLARRDVEALRDGGPAGERPARGEGRRRSAPWDARLEQRLRSGDERGAWGVLEAALAAGAAPQALHLDVLAPAMRAIGSAWEVGEIDVAVEHRASVIAMRLLGRLGPRFARRGRSRGTVVVGAPAGELHGLPLALLADLVRGVGYEVADLGADVPAPSLAAAVAASDRLAAVLIGVTTAGNDEAVAEAVRAAGSAAPGVPVFVGGQAVDDADHASRLGADGWGLDGRDALALLDAAP